MTAAALTPGRRWVSAACLLLAPVTFTVSELAFPQTEGSSADMLRSLSASPGSATIAIAAMGLTAVLFMPALFALLAVTPARGSGLTSWGAGLFGLGLIGTAGLYGLNVAALAMSRFDLEAMARVVDSVSPGLAGPLFASHWVMVVGALVLGIGLWRAQVGPRWAAACIGLCGVADMVLGLLPLPELVGAVVSEGAMIAGFAAYGWYVLREPRVTRDAEVVVGALIG